MSEGSSIYRICAFTCDESIISFNVPDVLSSSWYKVSIAAMCWFVVDQCIGAGSNGFIYYDCLWDDRNDHLEGCSNAVTGFRSYRVGDGLNRVGGVC